jgi:hypothetical protein
VPREEIGVSGHGGRRRHRPGGPRRPTPTLAIVVQGGTVQGVYADRRGPCRVYLLDYDDLGADDRRAEHVGEAGALPEVPVESGLARAVAEYRAVATRQAWRRRAELGR